MQKSFKKSISILLSILMIVSVCAIVPITASAAVGDFVPESEYLTFTAVENNSSVTLNVPTGNSFQYNINNSGWQSYTVGSLIALVKGDSVSFRGKDTAFNASNHVSIDGKVVCSGNVMSLRLDEDGRDQGLSYGCFNYMFEGCTGLISAPELPETTLANRCYESMFFGCTNLTVAPELPATTLAAGCYSSMFVGCESLTTAPELPATTLATGCYERMFYTCRSLTTAPELPATTLKSNCYKYMFAGCSSIKLSETQTDEYSIPYSVPSGGNGTTATDALRNMFVLTGGTFAGTPEINKTYYLYREVPKYTVTWKNGDTVLETDTDVAEGTTPTYDGATPTKTSDTYYDYTFSGWFDGSNTYAADALPAVSGDVTYTAQFTSEARTFMVFVKKLTGGTINVYDVSGETTVAQLKDILASQTGAPASAQQLIFAGKTLDDAKTLAEYNIQKESTIHLVIRGYTVTWKNWNGDVLETDTGVAKDSTPTYDGETPYKADGANCIYTFSGWTPEVTAVTGDATYTATFTESEKPETIKDCTNKYGDFRLYANVPLVQYSDFEDILDGAIIPITYGDSNTMIPVQDAKGYSYKFYDQTGTEIPAQIANSSIEPGSHYEFSDDVTVYTNVINFTRPAGCTAIYIVATEPAPAPAQLILNVGENGKVVMDNGTFGNATNANNITDIAGPINVADGTNASIVDGHTCNLVEGGSINIATGGRVSFYVSADNTGVITAIPDEGYICTGWYNGDTLYSSDAALSYQSISEDITLTAKFTPVTYTVTWKNWDGTELASEQVNYGATPIYDDQDPVKPDDELYKYTFTGWAPDVTAVTGDAEYTAQFDREDRGEIIDGKYYVDGVLKKSLGLIYLDGEYYYVMVTGEIYKNNSLSLAESKANGYIPQGRYYFDNEGKISYKNGIVAGYYYVNDELQKGAGLVKIGNDFYFVKQNGAVYKDASLYVAEAKTNGLMPAGKYFFDENGKMEVKNGVYGGFYYENNEIVKGKGIVEFENNLYFVKQNGAVYTTHHLMVPEAKTNGLIEPGLYDFEDDGRLIR